MNDERTDPGKVEADLFPKVLSDELQWLGLLPRCTKHVNSISHFPQEEWNRTGESGPADLQLLPGALVVEVIHHRQRTRLVRHHLLVICNGRVSGGQPSHLPFPPT